MSELKTLIKAAVEAAFDNEGIIDTTDNANAAERLSEKINNELGTRILTPSDILHKTREDATSLIFEKIDIK